MSDAERRELEREAKAPEAWEARLRLAHLRARAGELEILGAIRSHLVVRDGHTTILFPTSPDANTRIDFGELERLTGLRFHGAYVPKHEPALPPIPPELWDLPDRRVSSRPMRAFPTRWS